MTHTMAALATNRLVVLSGIGALITSLATDQITKHLALSGLPRGESRSVLPFFDLRLSFNEGVSFGMFAELFAGRPLALAGITSAMVLLLAFLLLRSTTRLEAVAFGAIIGGALGNIADRLRIGAVVDFLDFHVRGYHWPAFNLADTAIVVGVAIVVITSFAKPLSAGQK